MLAKFSVNKPLTVIMALLMVVVLGYVSFTHMTTDLLPNMELAYVAVVTTYPGASPEKVEVGLTKPLEQALSTTGGVKNVSSVSSENFSMILLEFSQDTNMDSAIIELSGKVDMVAGSLDEAVGVPTYMKIKPDLLPVVIASVDIDGMDRKSATPFIEEQIIPAFERIDGVASVSTEGLISELLEIQLSDTKIDELNKKIEKAIDETIADKKGELDKAVSEYNNSQKQFETMRTQKNDELAQATVELYDGLTKVQTGIGSIEMIIKPLDEIVNLLNDTSTWLNSLSGNMGNADEVADKLLEALTRINDAITAAKESISWIESVIPEGNENEQFYKDLMAIKAKVEKWSVNCTTLINELENGLAPSEGVKKAAQTVSGIATDITNTKKDLEKTLTGLRQMQTQLMETQKTLESAKMLYNQEMAVAAVQLLTAKQTLDSAQTEFDKAKDEAYKAAGLSGVITMDTVSQLISAENFSMPVGSMTEDGIIYSVKVGETFADENELINWELFNIPTGDIGAVTLKDISDVVIRDNSEDMYARVNGNDGIILSISKQSTAATTDVTHKVASVIKDLEGQTSGLHISTLSDQGNYIDLVIDAVIENLLLGGALAIIILFIFLLDIKPTLIISISIPASLLFAVVLMYFTGVGMNIISLAGLALGVGMLVDNSIVVIENIYRLRHAGVPVREACIDGAKQVGGAIIASTLTTVSVFLPIVFTEGLTKQIFSDMGLTITYSLVASLIVALTVVPAISSKLLVKVRMPKENGMFERFLNAYGRSLNFSLKHKILPLGIAVIVMIVSIVGVFFMGTEFIPESDSAQMSVSIEMPKESTRDDTRQMTEAVIDRISEFDDVKTIAALQSTGSVKLLSSGGDRTATIYLLLKDDRSMSSMELADKITEMTNDFDCTISVSSSEMNMSMLTGSGVEIQIKGDDMDEMQTVAKDFAEILRNVSGTINVSDGLEDSNSEIRVIVDKDEAMKYSLTVAQVYMKVSELITNQTTSTKLELDNSDMSVIVKTPSTSTVTPSTLGDCIISVKDLEGEEKEIKLSDIAEIKFAETPSSINRENQRRVMTVSAEIDSSHNIGKVSEEVQKQLAKYNMPSNCTYSIVGENEYINTALNDLVTMVLMAVLFIYMIMVAQFQSLKSPFIVIFTIPLAFTGGLLLLWVLGFNLSVIAMLGFLVLSGVVVNNGIVFVDYANQLIEDGMDIREALITTGKHRMRPIIMTALTTILGLSTIAMGIGNGTDMIQPMAIVVIGGLLYATVLTMYVIPALYEIFNRKGNKSKRKNKKKDSTNEAEQITDAQEVSEPDNSIA